MPVNKVIYGNQTVIDLTDATLNSSDELVSGVTAYDRSGALVTGTGDYMGKAEGTENAILIDDGSGQATDSQYLITEMATVNSVRDLENNKLNKSGTQTYNVNGTTFTDGTTSFTITIT